MSRGRRATRAIAAATVTAVVLAALVWTVRPGPILDAMVRTDPLLLALAIAISLLLNTVQSAEVLRWTLRGLGERITFGQALSATAGNMAIKATLPAGTGELTRAAYLHRVCGVGAAPATAVVLAILWLKLCWLLAMAVVGWLLLPAGDWTHGGPLLAALALSAMLPWLLRRRPGPDDGAAAEAKGWRGLPAALSVAMAGIRLLPFAAGALHGLLAVLGEIFVFGFLLHAGGVPPPLAATLAFVPLAVIGAKIPITLLGLGTREALIVTLMSGTASLAALAGAGLLFSAVSYVLPAALGTALTWSYLRRILAGR